MQIVPTEKIHRRILVIRGLRVLLDVDLARLYGTSTKGLNQQIKRNRLRFPDGFMFRLSAEETREVVTNCDHLRGLKFSHARPFAFTEHGALMAASVLNSPLAIKTSIFMINAFVELRERLSQHRDLLRKMEQIEAIVGDHDARIRGLFAAIKGLMSPPARSKKRIGFKARE